jgi:hypothetical protein
MNIEQLSKSVIDDLILVSKSEPNERLPKEEQIRSLIFSELKTVFKFVCSERSYQSVGNGIAEECDIWAKGPRSYPTWMEIKRCWSRRSKGWVNKPSEQLNSWKKDISKLSTIDSNSNRYFFLVGVFDSDPLQNSGKPIQGVISNINELYPNDLCHAESCEFTWRDTGMTNIAIWVWHWKPGIEIVI